MPVYTSYTTIIYDHYLPFIPASLQTLGRVECAVASALAPPDLRTINPLNFLSAFWTSTKNWP